MEDDGQPKKVRLPSSLKVNVEFSRNPIQCNLLICADKIFSVAKTHTLGDALHQSKAHHSSSLTHSLTLPLLLFLLLLMDCDS